MKKFGILLVAGALVLGAYLVSFGLPASLSGSSEAGAPGSNVPAGAGGGPRRPGAGATSVVTAKLSLQPHSDVLRAIGSTVAHRSVDVVTSVSGMVTETSIQANSEVVAGDILVRLDDRTERLNLEIAQAELDQARQSVTRYNRLSGSSAVTAVDVADAQVAAHLAEANLGLAELALEDRTIRAPISGRIGLSDVEVGDRLSNDQIIVTIDDVEKLLIQFELPERSIGLLAIGRPVLANTPVFTGRTFDGKVTAFDSRLDEVTRSVTVRAQIDNPDRKLWSGMTFAVRMIDETDPLPTVPATAITWNRQGSGVWISEDNIASRVPVTILHRDGDEVWIETDIPEGTSVVTEGAQKLREGGALRVDGAKNLAKGDPA